MKNKLRFRIEAEVDGREIFPQYPGTSGAFSSDTLIKKTGVAIILF
jgi:hypothetical protein